MFSTGMTQQEFFFGALIIGLVTAMIHDKYGWIIGWIGWAMPCGGISSSVLSIVITGVLGGLIGAIISTIVFKII